MYKRTRLAMRSHRKQRLPPLVATWAQADLDALAVALHGLARDIAAWMEQPTTEEAVRALADSLRLPVSPRYIEWEANDETHGMTIDELLDGIDQTLDEWKGEG